jgi:hypothetical protein
MKKAIIILSLIFIPLAGICPQSPNSQKEKIIFEIKKQIFFSTIYDKPFSIELFKEALTFAGVSSPEIAFRQAVLETGNFTSELFFYGNNLFGMRLPRTRNTTATGEFQYHARYYHWFDSVLDYKLWQVFYARLSYDLSNYLEFLTIIRYATDQNYINKLQNIDIV